MFHHVKTDVFLAPNTTPIGSLEVCTVKEGLEEAPRALKPPNIQS